MMRTRLQQERLKRDMSYKDVAEAIGLTERAYRYIEDGGRDPSWGSAQRLRKLFGISSDELLVQEDSTPKSVTA
jgi:putative transcriptional regulator